MVARGGGETSGLLRRKAETPSRSGVSTRPGLAGPQWAEKVPVRLHPEMFLFFFFLIPNFYRNPSRSTKNYTQICKLHGFNGFQREI